MTLISLIHKLRSFENKVVLQAIEDLRARGWLEDGSLDGIRLCHARMQGADLFQANLRNIDFHQAKLDFADLSGANLSGAKLARTSLLEANFSGANLNGADLMKANLVGARNLTEAQLVQAKRLSFASMPDGQPYDGRFRLASDLDLARWGRVDVDDPHAMAYFLGVSDETYLRGQKAGQTIKA
jgi:uncharacterized protein YjbI with pentapeptide repeats